MNQHVHIPRLPPDQQMTVREFLAFTGTRPDNERWELIEGAAVMNASPTDFHQIVVANITTFLMNERRRLAASWRPMPGIGTIVPVSPNSLPQPDVLVKAGAPTGHHTTDDALVVFEVLSRSNSKADREWRRRVYGSVPNCQHYVTVSLARVEVVIHDRSADWAARTLAGNSEALALPCLGVTMPLEAIYQDVDVNAARPAKPKRKR